MEYQSNGPGSSATHGDMPTAYVTLILDETGSMQSCKGAAIAGVNEYLATLRRSPIPVQFTLTLFNSGKLEVRHRATPATDVSDLTEATYQPADTTPLYDAIGRTLTEAGRDVRPDAKKLCVILTDGLENASREYTRDGIVRMIKEWEGRGWTFVYLGADHDAWAAGGDLGIAGDNTVQFCRRETGRMFDRLGDATTSYLREPNRQDTGFWKATSNDVSPDSAGMPEVTPGVPGIGDTALYRSIAPAPHTEGNQP
ncbi:MAG: vWA domain-containing protein [Nitrospiraceae bacterium]